MAGDIRYARNGGVAIAYQLVVDGETDLAYVPDFVSNLVYGWESRHWRDFYEQLARSFRLRLAARANRAYTRRVAIEIGLADGTKLTLTNPDVGTRDVLAKLDRTMAPGQSAFITVQSSDGTFEVNAHQVAYVRDLPD